MIPGKFVCLLLMAILLTKGRCCECEEEEEETGNPILDAVKKAFNDDRLDLQVVESCVKHTEAMLAAAKSNVLQEVEPLSDVESCGGEGSPQQIGEYFDVMGTGKKEWRLAFRGTANISTPVYPAYQTSQQGVNIENGCKQISSAQPCTHHYRNDDALDNWQGIAEIAFVLYTDGEKNKQIIFDASGTTYQNWFQKSNVISSSWTDLLTAPQNVFSMAGFSNRKFYISSKHAGCQSDSGWVAAIDRADATCPWEKATSFPRFLFSKTDTLETWESGDVGAADVMAVFLKYQ